MAIEIAASFITVVAVGAELASKLYKFGFSEASGAGMLVFLDRIETGSCFKRKKILRVWM